MPDLPLDINPDIRHASTLPGRFYTDADAYGASKESVFARSWHLVGDTNLVKTPRQTHPFTLLDGCLDEPLLLTRDDGDTLHCMSNVCTHRGALVCEQPGHQSNLRCRYHGRRFHLDGTFQSMPEFEQTKDFPTEKDNLPSVPVAVWRQFVFAGLNPAMPLDDLVADMEARVGWLPIEQAVLDPSRSRDYLVRANWALYCDNYLEGFHIPFVHQALGNVLEYDDYETDTHRWSNVQVGVSKGGEDIFEIPETSPDHGRRIGGYYYWLFPTTMFNFYPWGVSVNVVKPLAHDRTRVSFLAYVWDASRLDRGAGAALDRVEREDEEVVESVQKGVSSRLYDRGRYSPKREQCVHHFHRLVAQMMSA